MVVLTALWSSLLLGGAAVALASLPHIGHQELLVPGLHLSGAAPLLGGARCALAPAVAVLRHLTACVPQRPCATAIERDLKKWLSFKLLCWLVYNPTLKCAVAGQLQGDFHLRMQSVKRPLGGMEAGGLLFTVVVNRQPE